MGPGGFFPTNPDLADISGRTDFDFETFYFLDFLDPKFPDFQVPDFQISQIWLGPSLGRAWALGRVGPSSGPAAAALQLGWGSLGWAGGPLAG